MSKEEIREREKQKMQTEVLARSPAGNIETVDNLKRRKLAIYWRPHTNPDGETVWVQTRPLPADALSKEQYFAKGFRLTNPADAPQEEVKQDTSEVDQLKAEVARLQKKLASRPRKRRRAKTSE